MARQVQGKRTKIVATVGPASESLEQLRSLIEAGVDVFRINFSHGDPEQRGRFLENIRAAEREAGRPVAICGDLCGPKIRVGVIENGEVLLESGCEITIERSPVVGTAERISTTLSELVDAVQPGETILMSDGRLKLQVLRVEAPDRFHCRIVVGGKLSSGKGVNLPQTSLRTSAITEKDREDLNWIAERELDYVALSFVQRSEDIAELRSLLNQLGCRPEIIAKIEKPQAIAQIDSIIESADAVMVARGDLGVEMDFPGVPIVQKMIALKCQRMGKPCIIATEMLESMIHAPRPTRAEVSDVSNAVFDRADAVMLSAESAVGEYPLAAVEAMARTVLAAEEFLDQQPVATAVPVGQPSATPALAASVATIMEMMPITAIATYTVEGTTARIVSKNRPRCPILSLSTELHAARRACLYYGAIPRVVAPPAGVESLLERVNQTIRQLQLAEPGDHVIVLTGNLVAETGNKRGLIIETITPDS